ncbi:hypothetical protein C8R47DRAFT_1113602 [Mycena vitilis]|nr:hypothetical protein C8R47DRAFT_1113602 [Mycena vitilis]
MPSHSLVLHIWPGQWELLSIHIPSLVAVLHLQLTIPGKFGISYCTNPDLSPSGTLPFLTDGSQVVSSLPSIIQYIYGLEGAAFKTVNVDASLNSFDASQKTAWCSHVEANLGALTSYMFYSLSDNWTQLTHPTLAYSLPVPQRYYVPARIRTMYRPRLEATGLWNNKPTEPKSFLSSKSSANSNEQIAQRFQQEKVVQTARDCLDMYARLLGENQFVFHERLTSLDVVLAAHVLVIIKPSFPDTLLSSLLTESYPTLVSHAERILARSLEPPTQIESSARNHPIWSLLPSLPVACGREKSEEDIQHERMTLGWVALAVGSVGMYLMTMGNPLEVVA